MNEYNLKEKERSWVLGCFETRFIEPKFESIKIINRHLSLKQMKYLESNSFNFHYLSSKDHPTLIIPTRYNRAKSCVKKKLNLYFYLLFQWGNIVNKDNYK